MNPQAQDILSYWLGQLNPETGQSTENKFPLWFGKSQETDDHLRETYGSLLEKAKAGELKDWEESPESLVALVILMDQFSRNIFRGTSGMYAADEKALSLSKQVVESGQDEQLPTAMRVFLYMPFMHSEELEDQEKCIEIFKKLKEQVPESIKDSIENNVIYAIKHRDIVKEYGRFPHRNEILSRANTPEEEVYLAQPGAGF
jgi:uncharacterized protein (DUF924 family)